MTTYQPESYQFPTPIDEFGLTLGLQRLPHESIPSYRARLLEQLRDRPGSTAGSVMRSLSRTVGLKNIPVFLVDLVLSGETPTAPDPRIVIDGSVLHVWTDYGNSVKPIELQLWRRGTGYFLEDVYSAINSDPNFQVTVLDSGYNYRKSWNLLPIDTLKSIARHILRPSHANVLHPYLRSVQFDDLRAFGTEKSSVSLVQQDGDYSISQGIVHSYTLASGLADYTYADFPFKMWWSPVGVRELVADNIDYVLLEDVVDDETGLLKPGKLGAVGGKIYSELLDRVFWGS